MSAIYKQDDDSRGPSEIAKPRGAKKLESIVKSNTTIKNLLRTRSTYDPSKKETRNHERPERICLR